MPLFGGNRLSFSRSRNITIWSSNRNGTSIVFHADSHGSELRCGGRINIFVIDETLFHEILFVFPHEVIHVS